MNVKDLIFSCSLESIIDATMKLAFFNAEQRDSLISSYGYTLGYLQHITPIPTDQVVLGIRFQEGTDSVVYGCRFQKPDLLNWLGQPAELAVLRDLALLSEAETERLSLLPGLPERTGYTLDPWNEILGYAVLPQNIKGIGAEILSAAILLEMTEYGHDEEQVLGWKTNNYAESDDNGATTPHELFLLQGEGRGIDAMKSTFYYENCRTYLQHMLTVYHALLTYTPLLKQERDLYV